MALWDSLCTKHLSPGHQLSPAIGTAALATVLQSPYPQCITPAVGESPSFLTISLPPASRGYQATCSAGSSAMCYLGWEALHRVPSSPLQFCPRDWGLPLCSGVSPLCPLDVPGLGQVLTPTRGVSLGPFSQPPLVGPCTLYLNWYLPSFARTFLNHHGAWGAGLKNPGRSPVWGSCSDRLLPTPRVPPALQSRPPHLV